MKAPTVAPNTASVDDLLHWASGTSKEKIPLDDSRLNQTETHESLVIQALAFGPESLLIALLDTLESLIDLKQDYERALTQRQSAPTIDEISKLQSTIRELETKQATATNTLHFFQNLSRSIDLQIDIRARVGKLIANPKDREFPPRNSLRAATTLVDLRFGETRVYPPLIKFTVLFHEKISQNLPQVPQDRSLD